VVAHLQAYRWDVAATVIDGRLYLLVALQAERSLGALRQTAQDCLARAVQALGHPLRAGIGQVAQAGELAAEARRGADRAVELGAPNRVVLVQDVHGRALLAEVLDFLRDQRLALSPELGTLFAHDREHGTDYVGTLRALLEVESDAGRAAVHLGIHVNTLRYRVRRIVELTGTDLADPDTRLALEMELRCALSPRAA
jgi:DNA-binding PucR family transcriptional regulator